MFIEKIVISGFRSFKYCSIDSLSCGQNVFIGPNGSGKSNLIFALDFVLTKNHYRIPEKEKFLYMCQHRTISKAARIETFVEIYFNNEDKYFPINDKKIILKRTISPTSNVYYINNKAVKFDEMISFLESGGFSLDNSYYLVKQGLIGKIASSNPKQILDILRSISGAKHFEEKKAQSMKINDENEELIRKMQSIVSTIENNLSVLNIDREKVENYNQLVKIKKYLTKRIKQTEIRSWQTNLRQCERERDQYSQEMADYQTQVCNAYNCLAECIKEKDCKQKEIETLQNDFDSAKMMIDKLRKELNVVRSANNGMDNNDFGDLEGKLSHEEQQLELENNSLEELIKNEQDKRSELKLLENKRITYHRLIDVLNSTNNSADRNQLIQEKYLQDLATQKKNISSLIDQGKKNLNEFKLEKSTTQKLAKNLAQEFKQKSNNVKTLKKEIGELLNKHKMNQILLCKITNELNNKQKQLLQLENEFKKTENLLNLHSGDMAIASKRSIETILANFNAKLADGDEYLDPEERNRMLNIINGYHGQIVDCFELIKPVNYALEVLMKNDIFYHIVTNEYVVVELLNEISKRKLNGTFKFILVKHQPVRCQTLNNSDPNLAQTLLSCVKNLQPDNNEIQLAIENLFSGKYICRSFDICHSLFLNNFTCDFATLEGEIIERFGVIQKISMKSPTKNQLYQKWYQQRNELEQIQNSIKKLEGNRDKILIQNLDLNKNISIKREQFNQLEQYLLQSLNNEENNNKNELIVANQLDEIEKNINLARKDLYENENRLSCLYDEEMFWQEKLEQELSSRDIEEQFLNEINIQIDNMEKELHSIVKKRTLLEKNIANNKMILNKRKEMLQQQQKLTITSEIFTSDKIDELKKLLTNQIEHYENELSDWHLKLKNLNETKLALTIDYEQLNDNYNNELNNFNNTKKCLQAKQDEMNDIEKQINNARCQIEQAGLIDTNFVNQLDGSIRNLNTVQEMNARLKGLNRELKKFDKFGCTNTAILRQYQDLLKLINDLMVEKNERLNDLEQLRTLIEQVEHMKNDIIIRTYKQVNIYFQEIFKELVPTGSAYLQFLISNKNNPNSSIVSSISTSESSDAVFNRFDEFEGIEILVSFDNEHSATDILSLSGGQKSLVSLAFIFALQRVDPTPLYIFDELDQNLDQQSRNLVAKMIRKLASDSKKQFIITTFRTQLVENTDQVFEVKNINGLSQVKPTTKENALEILSTIPIVDQLSSSSSTIVQSQEYDYESEEMPI